MKLRRNEYLPNPQIAVLLRSRAGAERTQISAWCSAHRRSAPSQGISRTPFTGRDAEAAEPKNRRAGREVCNLSRSIHGLQRDCARPHRAQRNGRGLARRPSGKYPSRPSAVQSPKGIEQVTSGGLGLTTSGSARAAVLTKVTSQPPLGEFIRHRQGTRRFIVFCRKGESLDPVDRFRLRSILWPSNWHLISSGLTKCRGKSSAEHTTSRRWRRIFASTRLVSAT